MSGPKIPAWKWAIVVMLMLATVVNYLDRQILGSVASFIKKDFQLKEEGYGTLESYFGYAFAAFLFISGLMADRWNLRRLYAGAMLVWSAAGLATGFATTLMELQLCRMVLGMGEAFNWPVAVGVVRRIIPRESQALANGIFSGGVTVGAVLAPLLVLGMVAPDGSGWRTLFKVVGFAGTIVVAGWLWATRGEHAAEMSVRAQQRINPPSVPFIAVFKMRTFWIAAAMGIGVNLAWHLYRVWLPRHLVVDQKFTDRQLQLLLIAFFLTADLGSIVFGYITRRLVGPHRSLERSRKIVGMLAGVVCLAGTPLLFQPGRSMMIPFYCLVGAGTMGGFALFYSFCQDIVPGHTSKIMGTIGASGWFIISRLHPLVGRYADTHAPAIGKFSPMLLVAGALPLLAAVFALTWPEKPAVPANAQVPSAAQNVG